MNSFELAVIEWPEGPGTSAPLVVARSQNPVLLDLVLRRLRSAHSQDKGPSLALSPSPDASAGQASQGRKK
jgi:hypothetical protein